MKYKVKPHFDKVNALIGALAIVIAIFATIVIGKNKNILN